MAGLVKKRNDLGLWVLILGLIIAKVCLAGLGLSQGWLNDFSRPALASAQEANKETETPTNEPAIPPEEAPATQTETKASAPETQPPTPAPTEQTVTPTEALGGLAEKQRQLEAREKELEQKQRQLETLQAEVDQKIATLEKLRQEFEAQVAAEKARHDERIKHLVSVYSNMKPQAAAAVIEKLDEEIAVEIFRQMRGRDAGKILAFITPARASRISEMLSTPPPKTQ